MMDDDDGMFYSWVYTNMISEIQRHQYQYSTDIDLQFIFIKLRKFSFEAVLLLFANFSDK